MRPAPPSEEVFGFTRSTRKPGGRGLWLLFPLLLGTGCFQPEERADEALYAPWNSPAPTVDAASQPVFGFDAAIVAPPAVQDSSAAQPRPVDSSTPSMPPGFPPFDTSAPAAPDGSATDAGTVEEASVAPDMGPPGPPPTALTFSVLTKSLGGRYAPRNVGAIWIADASGRWIKTLAVWAFLRERYLTRFRAASGGNRVDAITGATLSQHTTHSVTWDLTDATGASVPDGDYSVVIETTDRDATGDSTEVPFKKGPSAVGSTPPDVTHYVNMSLALE